jgi:hypothetical protein
MTRKKKANGWVSLKNVSKKHKSVSSLMEGKYMTIDPVARITEEGYKTMGEWLEKDRATRGEEFDGAVADLIQNRWFTHAVRIEFPRISQWIAVQNNYENFLKWLVQSGYLKPEWVTQQIGSYNMVLGNTYVLLLFLRIEDVLPIEEKVEPIPESVISDEAVSEERTPEMVLGEALAKMALDDSVWNATLKHFGIDREEHRRNFKEE